MSRSSSFMTRKSGRFRLTSIGGAALVVLCGLLGLLSAEAVQARNTREPIEDSAPSNVGEAITVFRKKSGGGKPERTPLDCADLQLRLGAALAELGKLESGTVNLERAVSAYREALEEYTRTRHPIAWATRARSTSMGGAADETRLCARNARGAPE